MKSTYANEGKLFVISGPSAAGKGTICKELVKHCDVDVSISMTTRSPRTSEEEGREYFFKTEDEFRKQIDEGNLLEYATVYGNMYGTPKDMVLKKLATNRNVILEIDIQGGLQVRKSFPNSILIFVLPPSLEELRSRIVGRNTEDETQIENRINKARSEIALIGEYDYYVVNDDLEEAVRGIKGIIDAEAHRVPGDIDPILKRYGEEN